MSKLLGTKPWYNSKGKFKTYKDGKVTESYNTWKNIFDRCYRTTCKNPTYLDIKVSEEWFDYQNFAKWFYENKYYQKGWHLDKDIVLRGNDTYCPEYCVFVPREINNLFTLRKSERGDTPSCVVWHERLGKYEARSTHNGKLVYHGVYENIEDAFLVAKAAKESEIRLKANKYKNLIDPRVYDSLISWEVHFND